MDELSPDFIARMASRIYNESQSAASTAPTAPTSTLPAQAPSMNAAQMASAPAVPDTLLFRRCRPRLRR